ncbi:DNA photolyase, FAD-binding/Cryptochrome [Podospora aff. communis PSN243]|uniref:Cryptochrome DASH n=1 Tax=Podospora aff. communis PSN243 TaxID=3040156 RepID=A0AAV9GHA1_9PEZI|nr:DNA photolyase, FAD-binding/Cryptochrome [Podospora aff. communis PSN243]
MLTHETSILVLRKDLRCNDHPPLHHLGSGDHGYEYLVPVYVFPNHQIDLSGLIPGDAQSPYPKPMSQVGNYPRCGPHRAKFIAEAVYDLKESLKAIGSDLLIRAGDVADVIRELAQTLGKNGHHVGAVWMTSHEGTEEKADEKAVASLCEEIGAECTIWVDEKYFIDDRDAPKELPEIYTTYRKICEPLRDKPRPVLPSPKPGSLPKFPNMSAIPAQAEPFVMPENLDELVEAVVKPVASFLEDPPKFPDKATSAHPFKGGESKATERLLHLVQSEGMKHYKDTRNGLIGTEFSTKLSAYLAQGCITARQVHHCLLGYENGTDPTFEKVDGYGAGENEGTKAIRFELLWRDYMRLCHQKYGDKLFRLEGFKGYQNGNSKNDNGTYDKKAKWKTADKSRASPDQNPGPERIAEMVKRFNAGTTGMGLIDAAQRELLHTGYASNRARQNVASFLSKHLDIDWRYGAEWYEMLLVDYDVSSNWANWQYVSGVGNDPRGEVRIFNPVKQAFEYDKKGEYVRSWVPEVAGLNKLENVFQAWTASEEDLKAAGLADNIMVTDAIKRIDFLVDQKPAKPGKRPYFRRRGRSRGGGAAGAGDSRGSDAGATDAGSEVQGMDQKTDISTSPRAPSGGDRGGHAGHQSIPNGPGMGPGRSPRGHRGGGRGGIHRGQRGYQGQHGSYRGSQRGYHHGAPYNGNQHHNAGGGGGGRGYSRGGRYAGPGYHGVGRGQWDNQIPQQR